MIRFHVVNNQVIDSPVPYLGFDIRQKFLLETGGGSVNQSHFLIHDEIRIIAYSIRQRPLAFEEFGLHVVNADIADFFT